MKSARVHALSLCLSLQSARFEFPTTPPKLPPRCGWIEFLLFHLVVCRDHTKKERVELITVSGNFKKPWGLQSELEIINRWQSTGSGVRGPCHRPRCIIICRIFLLLLFFIIEAFSYFLVTICVLIFLYQMAIQKDEERRWQPFARTHTHSFNTGRCVRCCISFYGDKEDDEDIVVKVDFIFGRRIFIASDSFGQ